MTRKSLASATPVTDDSHVTRTIRPLRIPISEITSDPPQEERRPLAPHTSYSQLSTYLTCGKKYYFRYVAKLPDPPKVSTSIGKGGHAALEWNTKAKIATGHDHSADEVVSKASDMMDHYLSDMPPSEYEKDAEPGALKDRQLAATRIHIIRDAPKILPLAAEASYDLDINKYLPDELRAKIHGPIRPVNLHIDHLYTDRDTMFVEHEGMAKVAIEDYKFVTRKKSQLEANISPQLTTYAAAIRDATGRWPTRVGLRQFHPGSMAKNPRPDSETPDSVPLYREPELMTPDALHRRMVRLAYQFADAEEGIRAGRFIPVDDPITCSWCPFRQRCQDSLVDDFEAAQIRQITLEPAA